MPIAALIKFITSHSIRAVKLHSGKILAEESLAADEAVLAGNGHFGPYWSVIDPTLGDVRDWLGY